MKQFCTFLLSLLALSSYAQPTINTHRLDSLLTDSLFQTSQVAVMVYDLTTDSTLYTHNHRQHMRPASTQKLITAITALHYLSPRYELQTKLYSKGEVEGRTFKGRLYCVGGFDPMFEEADMEAFVTAVKALEVDTIVGQICADKTMRSSERLGEGWCWDDKNPVLSPLLYKRNDKFADVLLQQLRKAGIVIVANGSSLVADRECPRDAKVLCRRVHTLPEVLRPMMKESDNLYAEAVFYQLAAIQHPQGAHAKQARRWVKELLSNIGISEEDYRVADGSGLSLYNYTTAEIETLLLRFAFQHAGVFHTLNASLPIAGVDGTLKKRMKGTRAENVVRAKTGTLTGIYTLAGYATAANGHRLCFAIMNQGVMHATPARNFQDKVCQLLCEGVESTTETQITK